MADAVTLADGTVASIVDGALHVDPPAGFSGDGQALALAASQDPVVQALLATQSGTPDQGIPGGFTYSGNPGNSPVDYVRFTLGDTDASKPKFTDAEITSVLASYDNLPVPTLLALCDVLVSRYTMWVDESVGSVSMAYSQIARNYEALGDRLRVQFGRKAIPWAGGVNRWDVRSMARDPARVQPKFKVGMFNSPTATLDLNGQDNDSQGAWYGYRFGPRGYLP